MGVGGVYGERYLNEDYLEKYDAVVVMVIGKKNAPSAMYFLDCSIFCV